MKETEIIPFRAELAFITRVVLTLVIIALVSLFITWLLLDRDVPTQFRFAFRTIDTAYNSLNACMLIAVSVQLLISAGLVLLLGLWYSHRIAGPMYRLKMVLQQHEQGQPVERLTFRRTDYLPGVATRFTALFTRLNRRDVLIRQIGTILTEMATADPPTRIILQERVQDLRRQMDGTP